MGPHNPGTDYADRRTFSIVLDDAQLEDKLEQSVYHPGGGKRLSRGPSLDLFSPPVFELAHEGGSSPPTSRPGRQSHLQSADLFDFFSPVQRERQRYPCKLADMFGQLSFGTRLKALERIEGLCRKDEEEIEKAFPIISAFKPLEVQPLQTNEENTAFMSKRKLIRVGVVLSGGPAPGGHNVIAGIYDYIKKVDGNSQLLGFLGGLDGFFAKQYVVVNDFMMKRFRNSGGFDMFWSGRGKVDPELREKAVEVAENLDLRGLIIIGGDGSNSNAAILAELFAKRIPQCCVIGIPKTIDGDLKNVVIECSFGFDTAAKTYSELIGNLCTDVCSGQGVYHFVRVMGRSASHLVYECAMQTRPNMVLIGEEIAANNVSLHEIVDDICHLIIERHRPEIGRDYGVILMPEGLIEFIPDFKTLISELSSQDLSQIKTSEQFDPDVLLTTESSRKLWKFLPATMHDQLLGDREATGYIQVAKVATERLLISLVDRRLAELNCLFDHYTRMPHYFGYEGRCAMPSNFDANYCYNLGCTAACLIEHNKTGYMAVVRELVQHPSMWRPIGVPFPYLMEMVTLPNGHRIPGITRQLLDVKSKGFHTFCDARREWRLGDYYRCPGPIQFEGPVADISNYTVSCPEMHQLLDNNERNVTGKGRLFVTKRIGCYSELQRTRLTWRPELPPLCEQRNAQMRRGTQYRPKDPYVRRQVLINYPELCRNNDFFLMEARAIQDGTFVPPQPLRIGVTVLSRQAPGMLNIIWGMHERCKKIRAVLIGFRGINGVMNKDFIQIEDEDLTPFKNMGGIDLLGRGTSHELLKRETQQRVMQVCEEMKLDGLILMGSSLGMTEAALLSEYFLEQRASTLVIGIPATASNNVMTDLIETNVGFDTASKLYASLIGNVLSDAASMPKYWHFVRLMGRQPSNEVLECALQTHPNVVVIAEEYGAGQKTLVDVVNDIADVVCRRAEANVAGNANCHEQRRSRNFGAVLIPDGLWHHLPTMRLLWQETDTIMKKARQCEEYKEARQQLLALGQTDRSNNNLQAQAENSTEQKWAQQLSPWSLAVWNTLPFFIQNEFLTADSELRDSSVETEVLLSQMVRTELKKRTANGTYHGNFQSVCHYFGYQGRSAMPSQFDCTLAFTHGHLAVMCVESGITGHLTNVRGLCGNVGEWKLAAVPFNCLLTIIPVQQEIEVHPDLNKSRKKEKRGDLPVIPNAEVNLQCRALRWMKVAARGWEDQDRFCNPGPIQFWGSAAKFYHRILHEEQASYFHMLRYVQKFAKILQEACDFGVEESFLQAAYVAMNGLLTLRFHPEDVTMAMTPFPKMEDFENRQQCQEYLTRTPQHHEDAPGLMRKALTLMDGSDRLGHSQSFGGLPPSGGILSELAAGFSGGLPEGVSRNDSFWSNSNKALKYVPEEEDPMMSAQSDNNNDSPVL